MKKLLTTLCVCALALVCLLALPARAEATQSADYQDWTAYDELPASGAYRLTCNVTVSAPTNLTGNLFLDLNGKTITMTGSNYVLGTNGHKLVIDDYSEDKDGCVKTTATAVNANAAVIFVSAVANGTPGEFILNGGTIDGSSATNSKNNATSGAVTVGNATGAFSTFTMNGGVIIGQRSSTMTTGVGGSAIGMRNSTHFVMNGGTIYANNYTDLDDNVCCTGSCINAGGMSGTNPTSTITINGGTMYAGRAQNHGAAIFTGGNLYMTGGTIYGGKSQNSGAILGNLGAEMTITGGTIYGGSTVNDPGNGSAIDKNGGTLTIGGDAVIGGGVFIRGTANLVLSGKPKIDTSLGAEEKFNIRVSTANNRVYLNSLSGTVLPTVADGQYSLEYNDQGEVVGLTDDCTEPETPDVPKEPDNAADFRYTVENGEATITGYFGAADDVIIPATLDGYPVTTIDYGAFSWHTKLTSVMIPDSVTTIGGYAFENCSSLTSVTIPDSVTSIDKSSFYNCSSLEYNEYGKADYLGNQSNPYLVLISSYSGECKIHGNTRVIAGSAFEDCTSLISITIPESVTTIGNYAFFDCDSLTSVTIPDSVTTIGDEAFYRCTSLTSVTIPDSVTTIGEYAFGGCTGLEYNVYDNANYLGNKSNPYFAVISSVSKKIVSCTMHDNTRVIAGSAFSHCTSLTSVTIGNSVTTIGGYAFRNCSSLTSVTIPDSVTTIGGDAFKDCTSLTSVTIPASVTTIGDGPFGCCDSLAGIWVDEENANYRSSVQGVLFNKNMTKLIQVPGGITGSYVIPDSVTDIGNDAFEGCKSLIFVAIPDSVITIGVGAFYDCSDLITVTIPDSVGIIGDCAFMGCTDLTNVTIGNSVTTISDSTFQSCTSLTTVTIGNGLARFGIEVFEFCDSLRDVYYSGTQRKWDDIYKYAYFDDATVHYQHVHDYSLIPAITVAPTCTEHGYVEYMCHYGEKYRTEYVSALGHNNGADLQVVAPTCEDDGYTTSTCQRCMQAAKFDYVDSLGHDYSGKATVVTYCTKRGYTKTQCTRCTSTKKSNYTDPLGHDMVLVGAVEATCTEKGNSVGTQCSRCKIYGVKPVSYSALGHSYTDACDTTCNRPGCGAKRSITHNYKTTTTKATTSKDGSIVKKCTVCGYKASETAIKYAKTFTLSSTSYTYDGKVKTPSVTVKDASGKTLKKDTDYTVSYASGRKNAGTYKVTVTMKGNYTGTKTLSFTIKPIDISKCSIKLSATSYTYDGKTKTPSVTVKNANGTTLKKDTDYTVSYASGRKNAGTYKVTIKLKGNYTGTKTLTFKINPIKVTSKFTFKLSATSYTYDGKTKTPTVTVKNASGTTLKKDTDYTVSYAKGRKNVGTYKVTIKMKGNYTGTKTLTFKILPKAPSISKLTAKTKAILVKLNRVLEQSTGYEIQYSTSKTFKSAKTKVVKSYKTSSLELTGLKAKTTYYVRIRTYKTVDGVKYYSNWCTYKSIKTK